MQYNFYSSNVEFMGDVSSAITKPSYWIYSSILDASLQFRNNKLGFIWILLSSLVFVLVLGQLYPQLLGVSVFEYSVHLYLGLTIWNFISHSITESSKLANVHKSFLSSTVSVSLVDMVFRTIMKNLIICVHNLIPFFLFLVFMMPNSMSVGSLLEIVIGLGLIVVFVTSAGLMCTLLSSLLPDLTEILNATFRIGFLATPIIWMEDKITVIDSTKEGLRFFIDFNPFYHLVELVRSPIFDQSTLYHSVVVVFLNLTMILIIAFSYSPLKRRIEGTF